MSFRLGFAVEVEDCEFSEDITPSFETSNFRNIHSILSFSERICFIDDRNTDTSTLDQGLFQQRMPSSDRLIYSI